MTTTERHGITVHHGDCLDVLRTLPDGSVDSVVTDPPYGLEFMGKEWDGADGFRRSLNAADTGRDNQFGRASRTSPQYNTGRGARVAAERADELTPRGRGHTTSAGPYLAAGVDSVRVAGLPFQEWCQTWATECLRVLKPGGFMLAFGGTRTWHRLTCAIEDAGFEIRDSIAWLYAQGFPKSLDVSKAIDKAGGASPEAQATTLRVARERAGLTRDDVATRVGCTASSVRDWEEGRARATGAAVEFITPSAQYRPILADLLGYTADERRVAGTALDRRGDGTVIGLGHSGIEYGEVATSAAQQWQGWGTALKPSHEPIVVARKPLVGTVAANVMAHGTGALNIDGCRVSTDSTVRSNTTEMGYHGGNLAASYGTGSDAGRWPSNVVLDEHAAADLDAESGERPSGGRLSGGEPSASFKDTYGVMDGRGAWEPYEDTGGASRFFPVFRWQAKAHTAERPRSSDGVAHPTVKPLDLMRWLVRLVTPPGGTVLEPFAGSGTTIEACLLEGFHCIAIERDETYLPLIQERIDRQRDPVAHIKTKTPDDLGLFALFDEEPAPTT